MTFQDREHDIKWEGGQMLMRNSCDQCEIARINGVLCHETGCPNMNARYDANSGEWIKQRKCFDCGCTIDADDPCCSDEAEYDDGELI